MNWTTGPGSPGTPGWLLLDRDATVMAADGAACALLGVSSPATIVGRPWAGLVLPTEHEPLQGVVEAVRAGRPWHGTLRLLTGAAPTTLGVDVLPVEAGGGVCVVRLVPQSPPGAAESADQVAEVRAQRDALEALRLLESDPPAAAHAVLQAARSAVPYDWAVVLRFNTAGPDGRPGAEVLSVYPAPMAGVVPGSGWSPLDPAEAGVLTSGTPALTGDIDSNDGGTSPLVRLRRFGLRSRLHLPLFAGARVAGCVILYTEAPYALGTAEGIRLERILRPLGEALDVRATPAPEAGHDLPADGVPPAVQTAGLSALSELVSGVAHELNNPLTSILGYAQIFNSLDGPEREHAIATIEAEAQRAARIVRNLLSFARQGTRPSTAVDLEAVLQRVIDVRRYGLEVDNIRVTTRFGGIPPLMADEGQFEEVFLNLINNAQQALQPGGGEIAVATTRLDGNVRISVADNGPGVPEEVRARIFEPFFTTRDIGGGTGMGLSTVFGVVAEHGGRVWVEPSATGGANFVIELPIASTEAPARGVPPARRTPAGAPGGSGERILVVDDEPHIRALANEILSSAGYLVTTAANGEEALRRIEGAQFDLVVTDMRMPGMDGAALHAQVGERWPHLQRRMIFITGDIEGERTGRRLARGDVRYLEKPFDAAALLRAIREALDADV